MNCRHERVKVQWFLEKLRSETVRASHLGRRERRDDENWQTGSLHVFMEKQIPTADVTHAEIGNHEIRLLFVQSLQGLFPIGRRDDPPAFGGEHSRETYQYAVIVINQENGRPGRRVSGGSHRLKPRNFFKGAGGGLM